MTNKRLNIYEVAKRAGVSIASVSRTINKVPTVTPAVSAKVWKAIEELGYHFNTQARALGSGRSRLLGLIVSDIRNPFFPELISGFQEVAFPAGFEVLLTSTNYDPVRTRQAVKRMLERKVEGVAIMTSEVPDSLVELLTGNRVPLVFLDAGPSGPFTSRVTVNYQEGIYQAVTHLKRLGHEDIAFVSGPANLKSAVIRREAFLKCIAAAGTEIHPSLIIEGNHTIEGGVDAIPRLLCQSPKPTAILASNDLSAVGLLVGLDREGLRAPGDMSVVGFDDIDLAKFTIPPLTTVRISRTEIAHRALGALLAGIGENSNREDGRHKQEISTRLVVRLSTAALQARKAEKRRVSRVRH